LVLCVPPPLTPPHPNSGLPEFGTLSGRSRMNPTSDGEGKAPGMRLNPCQTKLLGRAHEPERAAAVCRDRARDGAVLAGAACLAQRILCRLSGHRRQWRDAAFDRARRGAHRRHPAAFSGSTRRARRRRTMARPGDGACRAHEACGRPRTAAPHDGRHGSAGLRSVRLQLHRLRERDFSEKRGAPQSMRAGRQGNRAHAQGAASGTGWRDLLPHCVHRVRCTRKTRRPDHPDCGNARETRRGRLSLADAPQQARLAKGDLAHRARSRRQRA
jgi:hypothetical protein